MDKSDYSQIYDILSDKQETRQTYESQAVQEMSDSILILKGEVKELLQKHLFDIKKVTNTVSEQLELTQNTLHHFLNLMILDPASDDYRKAQVDFRDAAMNFLESRN